MKITKKLTTTEVKYGILTIKSSDMPNEDLFPSLYTQIIIKDVANNTCYEKRTHLSVRNRIDGLTMIYKQNKVSAGDVICLELTGRELSISFLNQDDYEKEKHTTENEKESHINEQAFESDKLGKKLQKAIRTARDEIQNLEYLFFHNETNVRTEIVERILYELDWNFPFLAREQKGRSSRRVDLALYKKDMDKGFLKCKVLIEVKAIDKELDKDECYRQLLDYLDDNRFCSVPVGLITNGRFWRMYNRKGELIRYTDVLSDSDDRVMDFFRNLDFEHIDSLSCEKPLDMKEPELENNSGNIIVKYLDKTQTIKEKNSTETFQAFINRHLAFVKQLQDNDYFPVSILSDKSYELRNSSQSKEKINGKIWYITGDYSTYYKLMLIKQIIVASQEIGDSRGIEKLKINAEAYLE